jgi:hypothetical protein
VSWLLTAKVAADGGEIVAFESEEASGDVEGVIPEAGDFETALLAFEPEGAEGGRADAGRRALGEPLKRATVRWIQEQAEAGMGKK